MPLSFLSAWEPGLSLTFLLSNCYLLYEASLTLFVLPAGVTAPRLCPSTSLHPQPHTEASLYSPYQAAL